MYTRATETSIEQPLHDNPTCLVVESLRKSFPTSTGETLEVLKDVSFNAEPGETIAIMGVSGAGKSTLLHLLGGLESPGGGSVRYGQFDVTRASATKLARYRSKHIGFVFQFHHLLSDLTACENVALPLLIGRDARQAMSRAVESLEALGLHDRSNQPIGDLSGGEQQRVALARAIITRPKLVLADEPTGNLDDAAGHEIGTQLISYSHQHRAIVIIATHNAELANRCDRTLLLENGLISEKQRRRASGVQSGNQKIS